MYTIKCTCVGKFMWQRRRISCRSVSGECILLPVEKSVSRANSENPSSTQGASSYLTYTSRPILYLFFPSRGSRHVVDFTPKLWLVKQRATPKQKVWRKGREGERERGTHLASEPKICLPSTYIFTLPRITITFNAMQSEQCSRCLYICSARFLVARTWIMREIRTYKQLRQECGLRNWEGIRDFLNLYGREYARKIFTELRIGALLHGESPSITAKTGGTIIDICELADPIDSDS